MAALREATQQLKESDTDTNSQPMDITAPVVGFGESSKNLRGRMALWEYQQSQLT